jgi:hypothetical protein
MSYGSAITRKNEDVAQLIWSSLAEYDKLSSAEDMYSFQEQRSERETRHKNLFEHLATATDTDGTLGTEW